MIDDNVENLICNMDSRSVALDKSSFLFNNKTSKKEDSYIMDFIHGNSPLFGNCRRMGVDEGKCYFLSEYGGQSFAPIVRV